MPDTKEDHFQEAINALAEARDVLRGTRITRKQYDELYADAYAVILDARSRAVL